MPIIIKALIFFAIINEMFLALALSLFMPYADPTEQAEFNRNLFWQRYQDDPEFREAEALRKKIWYERNREKILARYRLKRRKPKTGETD